MKKNFILLILLFLAVFLSITAVSAATSVNNVTVQKKVSGTASPTVHSTDYIADHGTFYFTENGVKKHYTWYTHYIDHTNIYCNYTCGGKGGNIQFRKKNGRWYETIGGNWFTNNGTRLLSTSYNGCNDTYWLSWFYNKNRDGSACGLKPTTNTNLRVFTSGSKTVYDSYYKTYIYYTWTAYKTTENYVMIKITQTIKGKKNYYTHYYTKTGNTLKIVKKEQYGTFTSYKTTSLTAVQYYYQYFRNSIS